MASTSSGAGTEHALVVAQSGSDLALEHVEELVLVVVHVHGRREAAGGALFDQRELAVRGRAVGEDPHQRPGEPDVVGRGLGGRGC